ncbi:GAP family protein [Actinomadura sp. CNU-125]|uniref:GAP family protein n=1 Tax=Actinomadura sp. CNU-125 TaxID=1904961 RepID=UPI0009F9BF20|nr:GAP family protein [Actinomadura sp. CNU-125]
MSAPLALALAGLALLDSTSFGTLLIPIWLLLTPGRVRTGRIAVYLLTVAAFYFCVGVLLVVGADAAAAAVRDVLADVPAPALRSLQLAFGVFLVAWSYRLEARARAGEGEPGKLRRWREGAMAGGRPPAA